MPVYIGLSDNLHIHAQIFDWYALSRRSYTNNISNNDKKKLSYDLRQSLDTLRSFSIYQSFAYFVNKRPIESHYSKDTKEI